MSPKDAFQGEWIPAAHVTSRDVTDGAILVDLDNGRCWRMNATAAALWRSLASRNSFQDAIEEVAEPFGEDRARVAADMREFANELAKAGVLVRPSGDGVPQP